MEYEAFPVDVVVYRLPITVLVEVSLFLTIQCTRRRQYLLAAAPSRTVVNLVNDH